MKKLFSLLICIALLCAAAAAEGLSGLADNSQGLSGLADLMVQPLPDPSDMLGTSGTLIRENYQFSEDFLCNAYAYARPGTEDAVDIFLSAYAQQAAQCGYTVSETTVEGVDAYRMDHPSSGAYALLLPNFNGQILLLVEEGMEFGNTSPTESTPVSEVADAPEATAAPKAETQNDAYCEFTIDGVQVSLEAKTNLKLRSMTSHVYTESKDKPFLIIFHGSKETISLFRIEIPNYVQAGSVLRSDYSKHTRLFVLSMNGELLSYTPPYESLWVQEDGYKDAILGSEDYFTMTIEELEEESDYYTITASFEAAFNHGRVRIENGRLHTQIYK